MYGAIYGAATLVVWVVVFACMGMLVYSGAMFCAPCIDDVDIHAAALEHDAKEKHATCVLSAMEGAEANGEGVEVEMEHIEDARRESRATLSSGRRTVV